MKGLIIFLSMGIGFGPVWGATPTQLEQLSLNRELRYQSRLGNASGVKQLLRRGANVNGASQEGKTALHNVAMAQRSDLGEILIRAGADLNQVDKMENTALHIAAKTCNTPLAMQLVRAGANVNLGNRHHSSPLMLAAEQGCLGVVDQILLSGTAELNYQDASQKTAIDYARMGLAAVADRNYEVILERLEWYAYRKHLDANQDFVKKLKASSKKKKN